MIIKEIYTCEKCGKEFTNKEICQRHEDICDIKHVTFRGNIEDAVIECENKYSSMIVKTTIKTDKEIEGYKVIIGRDIFKFEVEVELANGITFKIYDGFDGSLEQEQYVESDVIRTSLDKAINDRLTSVYEGILTSNYTDGYRIDVIGTVEIFDIVERLDGKKVRLTVID